MPKRYNTPHRSRVVKTRLSEDEYADFTARLAPYGISQSEFLRQAIRRTTIRPVIHVSAVNDELLSAVGKLAAEYGRIGGNLNQIARYVHIVINSLRIEEVPFLPYMDRPADTKAGCKHRCTDAALRYHIYKEYITVLYPRTGLFFCLARQSNHSSALVFRRVRKREVFLYGIFQQRSRCSSDSCSSSRCRSWYLGSNQSFGRLRK